MDPFLKLQKSLRSTKHSLTTPRRAVFEALRGQEPLTIHQLVARCPNIDRATVYRVVALFERLGIVQRLQTGWKYRLELTGEFHEHHHHATCLRCGSAINLPEDAALEARLYALAKRHHFRIERHQIEVQGFCDSCSAVRT